MFLTAYVEISASLALGETTSTAYPGNKGKQNADNIAELQEQMGDKAPIDNPNFSRDVRVQGTVYVNGQNREEVATKNDLTWNSIQNKPSTFTPSSHTHDDRYYTEDEINSKLNNYLSSQNPSIGGNVEVQGTVYVNGQNREEVATKNDLNNYLPLSGGQVNGNLSVYGPASNGIIKVKSTTSYESGIGFYHWDTAKLTFGICEDIDNKLGFYDNANTYGGGAKWYALAINTSNGFNPKWF